MMEEGNYIEKKSIQVQCACATWSAMVTVIQMSTEFRNWKVHSHILNVNFTEYVNSTDYHHQLLFITTSMCSCPHHHADCMLPCIFYISAVSKLHWNECALQCKNAECRGEKIGKRLHNSHFIMQQPDMQDQNINGRCMSWRKPFLLNSLLPGRRGFLNMRSSPPQIAELPKSVQFFSSGLLDTTFLIIDGHFSCNFLIFLPHPPYT